MFKIIQFRGVLHWSMVGLMLGAFVAQKDVSGQVPLTGNQVNASGQKQVTVTPARLRLVMPIQVEGRDTKEAVKEMAAFKEHVKSELISMNADPARVVMESNTVSSYIAGGNDPSAGGRMYVPVGVDTIAQAQESQEFFRIYVARSSIQADWILPTNDLDALSLLPEELRKQIQDRDLQGKKTKKLELTDEERDMADSYARFLTQQRNAGGYYTTQAASNTEVQIFFVGILTPEEEKGALSEAYKEALASAEMLAEAAGRKLGELRTLSRTDSAASSDAQYFVYDQYGNQSRGVLPRQNNREVLSPSPNKLQRNIVLNVSFALENPGSK